ncbi:MAG: LTA synthase family protein [Cyclobacteriaceae bacterium]|nr:LTA synthase family protein [Cyclobacteriaceae bacterium]
MKDRLKIFVWGFLSWVIYFLGARAFFMIYQWEGTSQLDLTDIFLAFANGVRMDMAMAGYLSLLPGLLLSLLFFLTGKTLWKFWFPYQVVLIVLTTFIVVLDAELYVHWGFRLDATPILYFGKAAASSGDLWKSVLLVLFWLISSVGLSYFVFKIFRPRFGHIKKTSWITLPALLAATVFLILPIRGSLGIAPMNTGFVYFSKNNLYANHAAVNVVWNFGYAVQKMDRLRYPNNFFDKKKTEEYFSQMFPPFDSTRYLLNTKKPNVILIVLESYTFRFIEPLGGIPGIAPRLSKLVSEGILFDNFYSSGDRTDKGIVSILNGYPSQPQTSIIKDPKKTKSLPFLNQAFKKEGYHTEFTFGNDIDYSNFRSYLINAGFDHITHSMDFPQELNTGKWGIPDHYVFERFFTEADTCRRPFFKAMLTLSSHEPFDVPMKTVIKGDDDISKFLNSAYYTDKSLGDFIDKAKQTDWWKNTLVVITADHGHPNPDNQGLSNPRRFRIPMIWLGGALAVRDTVVNTLGCQADIANTVLGQVDMRDRSFGFSHDMFDASYKNHFAVFIYNNGYGFKTDSTLSVFDTIGENYIREDGNPSDYAKSLGKAYMQKLYWDFNSR